MDEQTVRDIASKVIHDSAFYIALVGLIGAVLGSVLIILGNLLTQNVSQRAKMRLDEPRRKVLKQMLEGRRFNNHWRRLDTLMHVIGADEGTTTRLLLELGARGSEDGQRLWGLMNYYPFKDTP